MNFQRVKTMGHTRISKRVPFRNTVHFGPQRPPEHTSFVTDMSESGLCVKTNKVYKPGTRLHLVIDTRERNYEAEGVVMWARKVPVRLVQVLKNGMGIKFTRVSKELVGLYQEKVKAVA